jgi:hypothetical protein
MSKSFPLSPAERISNVIHLAFGLSFHSKEDEKTIIPAAFVSFTAFDDGTNSFWLHHLCSSLLFDDIDSFWWHHLGPSPLLMMEETLFDGIICSVHRFWWWKKLFLTAPFGAFTVFDDGRNSLWRHHLGLSLLLMMEETLFDGTIWVFHCFWWWKKLFLTASFVAFTTFDDGIDSL